MKNRPYANSKKHEPWLIISFRCFLISACSFASLAVDAASSPLNEMSYRFVPTSSVIFQFIMPLMVRQKA